MPVPVPHWFSPCPGAPGSAQVAYRRVDTIEHHKSRTITLETSFFSATIQTRTRDFSYSGVEGWTLGSPYFQWSISGDFKTLEGDWSSEWTATLSEDFTAVESQIRFLDMRNNIIVTKDITRSVRFGKTSTDVVNNAPPGAAKLLHSFHFNDMPGKAITKETIHDPAATEIFSRSEDISQGDLWLAMIEPFGFNAASDKDYYDFFTEKWLDGGIDLYWPRWIRSMADLDMTLDAEDRDRHLEVIFKGNPAIPTREISAQGVPTPQNATGSWAVDHDGNRFFSQSYPGGVHNQLRTAAGEITDPVAVMKIEGSNPKFYPVAPL